MRARLVEHGGYLNKVDLKELGLGNNGLVAMEDIEVDDLIGFFPSTTFLTQTVTD